MSTPKPKSQELYELGRRCKQLKFSFKLDSAPGYTEISVNLIVKGITWDLRWKAARYQPPNRREAFSLPGPAGDMTTVLELLGAELAEFPINWKSLKVSSTGSPVKGAELKELVTAALKENFGTPPEASRWQEHHDKAVAALRAGKQAWDALSGAEQLAGSPFHRLDLSGLDLSRLHLPFGDWDFAGTNFSNTSLANGSLYGSCNFNHCSFERADLSGVYMPSASLHGANLKSARLVGARILNCKLRNANLQGADLTSAELDGSDFCGADLTGAILIGAKAGIYHGRGRNRGPRYDGRTRFPDGYVPREHWVRADEPDGEAS